MGGTRNTYLHVARACLSFESCAFGLKLSYDDGNFLGDIDSQAELSVCVRKGGFMVNILGNYNIGPNDA